MIYRKTTVKVVKLLHHVIWLDTYIIHFFQQFFTDHPAPAAERTVKQSLENIGLNIEWMKRDKDAVSAFLKSRNA